MAAINFPSNPLSPTDHTLVPWDDGTGKLWLYTSSKNRWAPVPVAVTGSGTTISAEAPTSPTDGAGWFDSTTSILSFWSADADAWIVPVNYIATPSTAPDNAYINGAGDYYVNGAGAYYTAA
jgi:hypothetical protein